MSEIIFKVHNGGTGDCFSIQNCNNLYVIDGGSTKNGVEDFKGKIINLCIVTHNDKDHTYGIEKMLKPDSDFSIDEIWLPGLWQPIINYVKEHRQCFESLVEYNSKLMKPLECVEFPLNFIEEGGGIEAFYRISDESFEFEELYRFHKLLIKNKPDKYYTPPNIDLHRILKIFALALKKVGVIRFFYPTNEKTDTRISGYPFRILNAIELVSLQKIKETNDSLANFFQLLYLTKNNQYSLVFEYLHQNNPKILFTADSDLFFAKEYLDYDDNEILITAPHHGSQSNKDAYAKIKSTRATWVKSGGSLRCLTGDAYKSISCKSKFCNRCISLVREKETKLFLFKEIQLKLVNNEWRSLNDNYCLTDKKQSRRLKLNKVFEHSHLKILWDVFYCFIMTTIKFSKS